MLENGCEAPGSVDRVLVKRMIRVCPETVVWLYGDHTPTRVRYQKGSRPGLERYVEKAVAACGTDEERIAGICGFCCGLTKRATEDLDGMRLGGLEEDIIRRGSDWCTEIARVACVLCQVAGLPARIVYLFDIGQAYSGHAIIEVYREGTWGAVCPETDVIYRHADRRPATTWDLQNDPSMIEGHYRGPETLYTTVGQFRGAAVSNYFVWEWRKYDYTVSGVNDYYRSILEMSLKGWPGGLRWLHGEASQ